MSNIQGYLDKIKNARFGKDVRQAIHDGIKQCYEDCATEENIQQIKNHINDNTVHTTKEEKNSWNKTAIDLKGVTGLVTITKERVDNLSEEIDDLKNNGTGISTDQYYEGAEVTAETVDEQKIIDAYKNMMSECMGDYDKIPFLLQTDNHNYFPNNIYELCGKMMNFPEISKIITLGDTVASYYNEKHLQNFVDAMKPFPIEKKITVAGNHDVWSVNIGPYIDQSKLSRYLKNYTLKRRSTNGYGVVIDDYFNVKYLIISNYDKEEGEKGSFVSTKQVDFIIEELSKNDGYDIVILTHEPISMSDSKATHLLEAGVYVTTGNYFAFNPTINGFIKLIVDRRIKGSGTYTDDEGVEHAYDFTNCNSELLCCFCGHTHVEAFDFISSELLVVSFGSIGKSDGKPIYFGYIDRKNRLLKYYRVAGDYSSAITVGLDKASATNMTLDKTEISMDIGSLEVISPVFTPLTAGNQRITWTSDNESVATVKKGFVTAVSTGTATITAVSEDGSFTATCSVTVNEKVATLTSISAIYTGGSVTEGTELTALTGITVIGTYSDGNTSVITNYTLSGSIAEGNNTITVSYNGLTTTFTVTGNAKVTNNLPSEYQEVEYLYSMGRNVAHVPAAASLITGDNGYITAMFLGFSAESTYQAVCGAQSKAEIGVKGNVFDQYANTQLVNPTVGSTAETNTVYNFEIKFTGDVPNLTLMAYNTDSKYGIYGRFYSAKFYRGEELIYNFVPCYRKSDGVIGVYDTVNNVFAEGIGNLFKGADV